MSVLTKAEGVLALGQVSGAFDAAEGTKSVLHFMTMSPLGDVETVPHRLLFAQACYSMW